MLFLVTFASALQDLFVGTFDAPRDKPAARLAHQSQHLFIHIVDATVAGPLDLDLAAEDLFTERHHMFAIDGEEVGIHVNVMNAQFGQVFKFITDVVG